MGLLLTRGDGCSRWLGLMGLAMDMTIVGRVMRICRRTRGRRVVMRKRWPRIITS